MTTPADADPSSVTDLASNYTAECLCLQTSQQNVLLEGPEPATKGFLDVLIPHVMAPVLWDQPGVPRELRAGDRGTLILRNVGELSAEAQQRVLRWLDDASLDGQIQIVSTSATPLFPLVERGLFDSRLYYRLNVVLLDLQLSGTRGARPLGGGDDSLPSGGFDRFTAVRQLSRVESTFNGTEIG
jgi:hypothetical protein